MVNATVLFELLLCDQCCYAYRNHALHCFMWLQCDKITVSYGMLWYTNL